MCSDIKKSLPQCSSANRSVDRLKHAFGEGILFTER